MTRPPSVGGRGGAGRVGAGGFSLIELLVGVLFLGLFLLVVQQFCRTLLRGVRVLEVASEAQEAARLAVQLIVADLREAGYGPDGGLGNGLRQAAPDAIELARDLSGDGDVEDANERVGYRYDAERGALLRSQGGAPPQPLLDGLAADGLRFSFAADDGALIEAAGGLDEGRRALVRRVGLRVTVELANPDPARDRPLRISHDGVAWLRNG